ncbi:MAG: GNAT family N-acetyltransferase [Lachnospiraceae bacterium]|nr:GNAT family N-acetyltransferase [Lachnospiraceae bacterium]
MSEKIELVLATEEDAKLIHEMKYEAFLPLYQKYHDDETSPVLEKIEDVIRKIKKEGSDYYIIQLDGENVGAIRISYRVLQNSFVGSVFYISPVFILPEYQNRGIGYQVMQKIFEKYKKAKRWKLDTIKQEPGNCYLYEKCGFVRTGKERVINENMTLVDYEKIV